LSSAPAVAAAQQLGIPTVLLEQNSVPGRATRWLAPRAKLLCAGMPQARHWLAIDDDRFAVTGNPVRAEFWQSATSPPANERTLVVLGGSGGARELNAAFLTALGQLNGLIHGWRIIHQTGVADVENVARHYALLGCNATVTPFIDHPAEVLSTADVVVSRGGAITLAELAALGKCAVVCPFSRAADQHQWHNAQAYAAVSACEVVDFRTGDAAAALAKKLSILLTDRRRRGELSSAMRRLATPNATQRVTTLLQQQLTATSVNRQAA
jgi:UDP-N-acetylglucosamine--N-acetylmuramyl-(pentapeptide) pyrophosphoryl-undecaprenol N-acetylglucosamine transferase